LYCPAGQSVQALPVNVLLDWYCPAVHEVHEDVGPFCPAGQPDGLQKHCLRDL